MVARKSSSARVVLGDSDQDSETELGPSKKLKVNQHGLLVLANGVIPQKHLEINQSTPSRTCDLSAKSLFGAKLSYALFDIVICRKNLPVEKHMEQPLRKKICFSAAPYSLSSEQS